MIEVKQRTLRTLDNHVAVGLKSVCHDIFDRADVGGEACCPFVGECEHRIKVDRLATVNLRDDFVFECDDLREPQGQVLRVKQLAHAQALARNLIDVRRAYPTTGCADGRAAAPLLFQPVERNVIRHDQMRAVADCQVLGVEIVLFDFLQ